MENNGKKARKLNFELVPDGCWYYNLRSILKPEQWDYIKRTVKEKAGGKCAVCGEKSARLDAHEKWSYDEKKGVQKLEGVYAVCPKCHAAIHIGRTSLKGDLNAAEDQYMKVNGVSYAEMKKDLSEANERHKRLNEVAEWVTDISKLKEIIGFDEDKKQR